MHVARSPDSAGVILLCLLSTLACASPEERWLDAPLEPFPASLSATGLYEDARALRPRSSVVAYEPAWPLWSNGSEKARFLALPPGTAVDVTTDPWTFPVGTAFFKTFSYGARPVETRVIRLGAGGWEYAVYRWRDDGSDADRVELRAAPTLVEVSHDGETFQHEVPNELQCRSCHESNGSIVIGFTALQLADGATPSLDLLVERGVLVGDHPRAPRTIDAADAETRDVMGYFHGNCVHCHNSASEDSPFSLEWDTLMANTVDVSTVGSSSPVGVRVAPGDAEASVLFRMLTRSDPEAQPMPPLGVQRADADAIALVRRWIDQLPSE